MNPQGQDRAWWFLDTLVIERPLATATDGVVLEMTLPVGAAPPLHFHRRYADSFYLLHAEMVVRGGDELSLAQPGQWVSTAPGVPHCFRVVGDEPARVLAVLENRTFLGLVLALGEPTRSAELPPAGRAPADDAVLAAYGTHDVTAVGPSLGEDEARAFRARLPSGRGAFTMDR